MSHAVRMPQTRIPIAGGRKDGARSPNSRTDVSPTNVLDALQTVGRIVMVMRTSVTASRDRLDVVDVVAPVGALRASTFAAPRLRWTSRATVDTPRVVKVWSLPAWLILRGEELEMAWHP